MEKKAISTLATKPTRLYKSLFNNLSNESNNDDNDESSNKNRMKKTEWN